MVARIREGSASARRCEVGESDRSPAGAIRPNDATRPSASPPGLALFFFVDHRRGMVIAQALGNFGSEGGHGVSIECFLRNPLTGDQEFLDALSKVARP